MTRHATAVWRRWDFVWRGASRIFQVEDGTTNQFGRAPARRLYLKLYRTESAGWDCDVRCATCLEVFRDVTRPHTAYVAPGPCVCNICRRQPPSLFASASNIVFIMVFSLERFELTRDVTYEQYVYAVSSNRVSGWILLPPDFPIIQVEYRLECCPFHKLHLNCPGQWSWHGTINHSFNSVEDAVTALSTYRYRVWCLYCYKPLFFPIICCGHEDDED